MKQNHQSFEDIRPWRSIKRRSSRQINVGGVKVGGNAPISVQSMTNTLTHDIKSTLKQIHELEKAGCDIIRVSCPDEESTNAFSKIVKQVNIPLIADIHFHYKRAIEAAKGGAACLRINPGNIGSKSRIKEVVQAAKDYGCSIRIGVNAGSLEKHLLDKYGSPCPDAMVESAVSQARILQDEDFHEYKISVKASDVFLTIAAYQELAKKVDCPLHLGITEAGSFKSGTVKSSIGLGLLLWSGIGDTIRVSLSEAPVEEVKIGFEILKSLNLRSKGVTIISCPSCARQGFNVIETVKVLEQRLAYISEPITLSIIGCVVNGPGEAMFTDIGFTGGGKGAGMVYIQGKPSSKIENDKLIDSIVDYVEKKAKKMRVQPEKIRIG